MKGRKITFNWLSVLDSSLTLGWVLATLYLWYWFITTDIPFTQKTPRTTLWFLNTVFNGIGLGFYAFDHLDQIKEWLTRNRTITVPNFGKEKCTDYSDRTPEGWLRKYERKVKIYEGQADHSTAAFWREVVKLQKEHYNI